MAELPDAEQCFLLRVTVGGAHLAKKLFQLGCPMDARASPQYSNGALCLLNGIFNL